MITLKLDGRSLRLEDIENVAFGADIVVQLDEDAKVRMRESRALIEELVLAGEPVYGVTTGFGRL
ncbi:MAG: aromatic amino acid lyase, partial [Longimicrobiales bacterium]